MTSEVDEAFSKTLLGSYDDDEPWEAVALLQRIGTREVFDRAAGWCLSENPRQRAVGFDVLAQLGRTVEHPRNNYPDESFSLVSRLVQAETNMQPLCSALYALGHIGNPLGIQLLVERQSHADSNVRFAVAFALGNFADNPRSTAALLSLMEDADATVRDWATFGLGVLGSLDSAQIRDALLRRSVDADTDVRQEALIGLGKRKDRRALSALQKELSKPEVPSRIVEAADAFLGERNSDIERTPVEYIAELNKRYSI